MVLDTTQFSGVMLGGIEAGQYDGLIAPESCIFLGRVGIETATFEIGLGAYHEECRVLMELIESLEIEVPSIHNVEGPWFRDQVIEDIDVVKLPVADINKRRYAAAQIQERMELDGGLGSPELCPRKDRQTEIDGGGIEGIDGLVQFDSKVVVDIESSSCVDKRVGEFCVDAPVSHFVGIGQGVSGNVASYPHVIQLVALGTKTSFDVPETLSVGELCESHAEILIETTEVPYLVVASITPNTPSKGMQGKVVHDLRKNQFA